MQAAITPPNGLAEVSQNVLILSVTGEHGWNSEYRLLNEATVLIGSASQCGLPLAGTDVSALHCSLHWDDQGIWLEDWGSCEGTFLDGERITTEMPVELGSTIGVGRYVIHLELDQAGPSPVAPVTNTTSGADASVAVEPESSQLASSSDRPTVSQEVTPRVPIQVRNSTLPVASNGDPTGCQSDAWDQETFEILRAEVEQLQLEVAERDAQLAEALAANHESETSVEGVSIDQLMGRLETLLDELDRSDERMAALEELLRVTEEANRDEREERRQMESWLGDIESVFGEHQATWDAEMTALRNQTAAVAAERDQLLRQLTQPAADDDVAQDTETTAKLRLQLKHVQQRLDEATAEGTRQQEELRRREMQLAEAAKAEHALREDHLKLAAERASLSRLRAEIAAEQADSQKHLQEARTDTDIDSRVRGFRQHLREIHDEDTQEDGAPSLPSRITRLWKRLKEHR